MSARVLCFASAKGGSGKTFLATTIATFLASLGKRVLLVDADGATNGLTLFLLAEVTEHRQQARAQGAVPHGLFELKDSATTADTTTLASGVVLVPATYAFADTDPFPLHEFQNVLRRTVTMARSEFDFIILDAEAGTDSNAVVAMDRDISDEVVIVSEFDPISAAGVERLKALLRRDLTYERTWILLNKMLPEFVSLFSTFLEVARYLSPIPWDPAVVRAYSRRTLAIDLKHGNEHTLAVFNTLRTLAGPELREALEQWTAERLTVLRQPFDQQYSDLEQELRGLLISRRNLENKSRERRYILMTLFAGIITILFTGIAMGLSPLLKLPNFEKLFEGFNGFAVGAVTAMLVAFVTQLYFVIRRPAIEQEMTESRLERQERLLRERLERLERLRSADLEVLLKAGPELETRRTVSRTRARL